MIRLNKYIAHCGVCSRRRADEMIKGGLVVINGAMETNPAVQVDPESDRVVVDGKKLFQGHRYYYILNKPKGVICTNRRGEQKPRAVDLVPAPGKARLFCVGRLDEDSEGLIIITNDGDFANRVAHPRYGVEKSYSVTLRGMLRNEDLAKVKGGIWLSEGRTGAVKVNVRRKTREVTSLLVTLHEGKNREVRRIFAAIGLKVIRLKRVRIGGVSIHKLKPGTCRSLSMEEVASLQKQAQAGPDGRGERKKRWRQKRSRPRGWKTD